MKNHEKIERSLMWLKDQINFQTSMSSEDLPVKATHRLYKKIIELAEECDLLFANVDELRSFYRDNIEEIFLLNYEEKDTTKNKERDKKSNN